VSITGTEVCVPADSPVITGEGVTTLPACGSGRTCPTDRTYECISSQCRLSDGQSCESDAECKSGSACTPATTGSGHVCTPGSTAVSTDTEAEQPFVPITPDLGTPIPGVSLSPATKEGDYVQVPFLAQYVNGVYRYLIGLSLIAAIVMTVYGGFRYLVGSSLGDVKSGKKIITDALGGMLIVLAAYMILNTINPATLNLSILNISYVNRVDIDAALATTEFDTAEFSISEAQDTGISEAPPSYGSCPVTLTAPPTDSPSGPDDRGRQFISLIGPVVAGGTPRDRVLHIAAAAASCGIALGSCGRTADEIFTAAGSPSRGRQTHALPQSLLAPMDEHKCASYSRECTRAAMATIFEQARSLEPGWPDSYVQDLEPGDRVAIYNANSGPWGLHTIIFMGWARNGVANVVQGAYTRQVRTGTVCLTSACSNPAPVFRTFTPR
jgi:hypothetical protein